jgi:hypothetical protein
MRFDTVVGFNTIALNLYVTISDAASPRLLRSLQTPIRFCGSAVVQQPCLSNGFSKIDDSFSQTAQRSAWMRVYK